MVSCHAQHDLQRVGRKFMDLFHKQSGGASPSSGYARFGKVDIPADAFTVMLKRD